MERERILPAQSGELFVVHDLFASPLCVQLSRVRRAERQVLGSHRGWEASSLQAR